MAAEAWCAAAFAQQWLHEWAQIGDPAIVSHHQLVELASGGDVLVLEGECAAGLRLAEQALRERVVDGGEHIAGAGKESGERAIALFDGRGSRRPWLERHDRT